MSVLARPLYLAYYLQRMNWPLLRRFMCHVRDKHGISVPRQWAMILWFSLRYNISLLEAYQFRFFELTSEQRRAWAGTGAMYEFQLVANPRDHRLILEDKRRFHEAYRSFFGHELWSIEEIERDSDVAADIVGRDQRLVFKEATGNCGTSIQIHPASQFAAEELAVFMRREGFDLVETFVDQHPALQGLSPSGVNTVRVFTLLDSDDNCRILGCRLRISVDSHVDNLAAGNLAAPIGQESGIVSGPGVYSDITRSPEMTHPVTGQPIVGFQVPFWQETLEMVRAAALQRPENRSIGWDVVITSNGPGLIEGNHDWCKLVWQLPAGQGLKHRLEGLPQR